MPTPTLGQPGPSTPLQTPQGGGEAIIHLSEFLKLKLPTFSGLGEQEDPHRFIESVEKACKLVGRGKGNNKFV